MRRSAAIRAAGALLLVLTAAGCVTPARNQPQYRDKATAALQAGASNVATGLLAVRQDRQHQNLPTFADEVVSAAETSMGSISASFGSVQPPDEASTLTWTILGVGLALWFAYEVPQLANTGQTLGKRLAGIKVMALDSDAPLGFRRAIRRWYTLGLPTVMWPLCGLGFLLQGVDILWLLIDRPLHQALHDKAVMTVVVTVGVGTDRKDKKDNNEQVDPSRS